MENRRLKTVPVWRFIPVGRGKIQGKGVEG
jgi:hypothetical protein